MKIVSLNGWGGKLHAPLVDWLKTEAPDVLCLHEVVHTPASCKDWLTYRDGDHVLPQRANFFADVAAALPDHVGIFCPAAQGDLWDGETAIASQWGLATFVRKTLPVIAQAQDFVHKSYSPHGYGDHPRSRVAHAVRVFDHEADRPVTIAHMHGLRDLKGKMDTPERRAQAQKLAELVMRIARPSDALIVCGDFNVEPGSETFDILGQLGLTDLVTARGFDGTRTAQYTKPGKFADYMLVNSAVPVRNFDVVRSPEISDHCPLILEI